MKKFQTSVFVIIACLAAAVVGYAIVTFDPLTGIGFVGKGDVQSPWGWNDSKLQTGADTVSFYYEVETTATYSAVCTWITGEGTRGEQTHNVTHTSSSETQIRSEVAYDTRKNTQGKVTGFNLTGNGATVTTESGDEVPEVGGPCPGNPGTDGTWSSVTETSSFSVGGLYAESTGFGPTLIWQP